MVLGLNWLVQWGSLGLWCLEIGGSHKELSGCGVLRTSAQHVEWQEEDGWEKGRGNVIG